MKTILYLAILIVLISNSLIAQEKSINENRFIKVGGIEQWITIKGEDKEKPVILFLHGGPGSVMSPYCDSIYKSWKKDFILVNWDQRGAGRTFGKNAPEKISEDYFVEKKLTLDMMVKDGIEVSEYLIKHLKRKKIILMGASWGSILGIKMAQAKPSLFKGYIGNAQFVGYKRNYLNAYKSVLALAESSKDSISINKLKILGKPPYENTRNLGQMLRIVKKYESKNSTPLPDNWWKINPEYNNKVDKQNRFYGDDYSFLYFAGHKKMGVKSMVENLDFYNDSLTFKVPIYIVQGDKDILTSEKISKLYFEKIKAPHKGYFTIKGAGHNRNEFILKKQFEILKEKI